VGRRWLGLDVGTDIALANAVAREILAPASRTAPSSSAPPTGFEAYRAAVEPVDARARRSVTGVPAS
jgi:anaerobic selenocysteine-containing dehydrogenase